MNQLLTEPHISKARTLFKQNTLDKMRYQLNGILKSGLKMDSISQVVNHLPELYDYLDTSENTITTTFGVLDTVKTLLEKVYDLDLSSSTEGKSLLQKHNEMLEQKKAYEQDVRGNKVNQATKACDILEFLSDETLKFSDSTKKYGFVLFNILNDVPLRLSELCNLNKIDNGNNNYLDVENHQIVLRNHKNDKKGNVRLVKLHEDTVKYLNDFPDDNLLPHSTKSLQNFFQTIVKRYKETKNVNEPITIAGFRRIYEDNNLSQLNNGKCDNETMKTIVKNCEEQLGHSLQVALTSYTAPEPEKVVLTVNKRITKVFDVRKNDDNEPIELLVKYNNGDWGQILVSDMTALDMFNLVPLLVEFV